MENFFCDRETGDVTWQQNIGVSQVQVQVQVQHVQQQQVQVQQQRMQQQYQQQQHHHSVQRVSNMILSVPAHHAAQTGVQGQNQNDVSMADSRR